jgi:hypothetical protein
VTGHENRFRKPNAYLFGALLFIGSLREDGGVDRLKGHLPLWRGGDLVMNASSVQDAHA